MSAKKRGDGGFTVMASVETLIEPLRHSPQQVEAAALLSRQIEEERTRRHCF